MTGQETYSQEKGKCGCGTGPAVESDSPEGREVRRGYAKKIKTLAAVQFLVGILAIGSGATSAGLSFLNPAYPYSACYPLVCGVLIMAAGVFGSMAARANMDTELPPEVKKKMTVHYSLCMTGTTFCSMAFINSAVGFGLCLGSMEICTPHRDLRTAFVAVDTVLTLVLFVTCTVGLVLFRKHARALGCNRRVQNTCCEKA